MSLLACGINHKSAPLPIREQVVFCAEAMPQPLLDLAAHAKINEVAILSTCNRTEFYCTTADPNPVIEWLYQHKQLPDHILDPCLYIHQDQSAVRHLLRVATGLDSMVLGEPQILGQLKTAYSWANRAGTLGTQLQHLFQYVFAMSKQVRTETGIGVHPVSIASTAVDLAKHIFADLSQLNVLFIGLGEMIELAARYLQTAGVTRFTVANRTITRAEEFANKINGSAITLGQIADHLPQVDMIISATASPLPILGKGTVERALKKRKHRLMFMVDLAVPRDIEPEIGDLNDVYLYTLDDLQTVIQQNLSTRQAAAHEAEALIDTHATHYMRSLNIVEATPVICAYREKAEQIRNTELARALQLLQTTNTPPEQILELLAHRLTNKLLHTPTQQLRQAAYHQQEDLLQLAQRLFEV